MGVVGVAGSRVFRQSLVCRQSGASRSSLLPLIKRNSDKDFADDGYDGVIDKKNYDYTGTFSGT